MSMNYEGIPGEYTYSQNRLGKSASGIVANGAQSSRNYRALRNVGGADFQPGDHRGHLIAHSIGGRNDISNVDAQAANVNQRDQANIERNVRKLAADPNNTVAISVSNYNSVGERPDATMINVGVRNNLTGVVEEQHVSFQNASHDLQESWNNSVAQYNNVIDPAQDVGMTDEQRDAANELCGEENTVDSRLGSGWSYMEFDSSFLDGGEVSSDLGDTIGGAENSSGEFSGGTDGSSSSSSSSDSSSDSSNDSGGNDNGLGE